MLTCGRDDGADKSEKYYDKECGKKVGQVLDPCAAVKNVGVTVDVEEAVGTVRFALGRLGHAVGAWAEYARRGEDGAGGRRKGRAKAVGEVRAVATEKKERKDNE